MLSEWLNPITVPIFKSQFLQKQPYARPNAATGALSVFNWDSVDSLLANEPSDILLVSRGTLIDLPPPRHAADLRLLMQNEIGIVIRRAERENPGLAQIALSFAHDLGGEPHIQLIATPGNTHGFGWHYDREDVFIVQSEGIKDYFFRDNTVSGDVQSAPIDFAAFHREVSPLGTARLIPGDWLYIPAGWWHMAKCIQDSFSVSVGVLLKSQR